MLLFPVAFFFGDRLHLCIEAEVVPRGLEPQTFRLLAERSNQLSYETIGLLRQVHRRTSLEFFWQAARG